MSIFETFKSIKNIIVSTHKVFPFKLKLDTTTIQTMDYSEYAYNITCYLRFFQKSSQMKRYPNWIICITVLRCSTLIYGNEIWCVLCMLILHESYALLLHAMNKTFTGNKRIACCSYLIVFFN